MNSKTMKLELEIEIVKSIVADTALTYEQIAEKFGVSNWYVWNLAKRNRVRRRRGKGRPVWINKQKQAV